MSTNKQTLSTQKVAYAGLAIALCVAGTFLLIPGPNGAMIHCGSAALYIVAVVLGSWYGAIGGAIGSAIFDIIIGLSMYTPFSLVIKGVSGFIAGRLCEQERGVPSRLRILLATIIASLWTLVGYLVAWYVVLDSWAAAWANAPFSLMTSAVGIIGAQLVGPQLAKWKRKNEE